MSHLTERTAIQVYDWYTDIERRLMEIVRILPFVEHAELNNFRSPRLVPILLEAASLVDVLLRDQLPSEFTRQNGKKCLKRNATISDYMPQLNPSLRLSDSQSLLLHGLPVLISPFAAWNDQAESKLRWWSAYNELKHDRLAGSGSATLQDCLYATCALNQTMMKLPIIAKLSLRFGWVNISEDQKPETSISSLAKSSHIPYITSYVAYTDFFATFLWEGNFVSVDAISPKIFRNSERLQSHLGRRGNIVE